MPSETRVIRFTSAELMTALFRYSRRKDGREKSGLPTRVELSQKGEIMARLHVSLQGHLDYNVADIAAALILICGRQKIPILKKANKSIHIEDDKIVLVLTSGDFPPRRIPT